MAQRDDDTRAEIGSGARRRRPFLVTLSAFGMVTGLLGVAGVFAAGNDQATTGPNDAISGETNEVDIQLAAASGDREVLCGEDWSDHLLSGIITSDDLILKDQGYSDDSGQPTSFDAGFVCLRNVGSSPAMVTLGAIDIDDTEVACSPGEYDVDGASCGAGVGELSSELFVLAYTGSSCETVASQGSLLASMAIDATGTPLPLISLVPGEEVPVCASVRWDEANPAAQSDRVTWRFAFDASTASSPPPPPCEDDANEPNDISEAATPFANPTQAVACPDNYDWYVLEHTGGSFTANLDGFDPVTSDLDLYLLDQDLNEVASSYSADSTEQIAMPELVPGTYYLVMHHFAGPESVYTLSVV